VQRAVLALLTLLTLATPARAQDVTDDATPSPAWHVWVASGGALPIGGPAPGVWGGLGVSGREWGVRLDGFVFEPLADDRLGFASGSLTYELGRTRRHLVMTAHFGGGLRFPRLAPIATGGLHTQLGLMRDGPLVLDADLALHVDMGQLPLDVYVVSTLAIGLAW
jgi:hypothetical protein